MFGSFFRKEAPSQIGEADKNNEGKQINTKARLPAKRSRQPSDVSSAAKENVYRHNFPVAASFGGRHIFLTLKATPSLTSLMRGL